MKESIVYYIKEINSTNLIKIFEALNVQMKTKMSNNE